MTLPKVKDELPMKLQTVEPKMKGDKDKLNHLERGTSVSSKATPPSKKVTHHNKSKQGKVRAHSLKSKNDLLQNWIRLRKLSGDAFLFDVSLRLPSINIL